MKGSKNGNRIFHKSKETQINSSPNQQYDSPDLFNINWGNKKPGIKQNCERDLDILVENGIIITA